MRANREGTMPAPHQHIALKVELWRFSIEVEYTARPCDLVAAGIVTPYMAEKILSGKSGARCDENKRQFRVRYPRTWSGSQKDAWNSGEPVTVCRIARTSNQALALPGVRELYPDGGLSWNDADQENSASPTASVSSPDWVRHVDRRIGRHRRRVSWLVDGNVIIPDWPLLRAATAAWREARQ